MRPDQQLLDDLGAVLLETSDDVLVPDISLPIPDCDWIWVRWYHRRDHQHTNMLGHATLIWSGDTLHWPGLFVPRRHTLTHLVGTMPEFWRHRGVQRFTAVGIGAWVWRYLEAVGFVPVKGDEEWLDDQWYAEHAVDPRWQQIEETPLFVTDIGLGCRMDQYTAWKKGELPEPSWHKQHNFRRSIDP